MVRTDRGRITPAPKTNPRQRLLAAALTHVAAHGIGDLSLRELAAAIGTSHRMLIYHFGSKTGLLVAIVEEVEERQRQLFSALAADASLTPTEAARVYWRQLLDPTLEQNIRLFFELYVQAMQGRLGTAGFLDRVIDAWVQPLTAYWIRRGVPRATARADARLGLAVTRGLLLDLAATGDRAAVDAAFTRFLQIYQQANSAQAEPAAAVPQKRTVRSHQNPRGSR
jgi:AcrR family transcriptional regulator